MTRLIHKLILGGLLLCLSMSVLGKEQTYLVLSYHDVRDDVDTPLSSDAMSITLA